MNTNIADIVLSADAAFRNTYVDIADIHSSVTATANAGDSNLAHIHRDPCRKAFGDLEDPFLVDVVAIAGKVEGEHLPVPILAKIDKIRAPRFPAEEVPFGLGSQSHRIS